MLFVINKRGCENESCKIEEYIFKPEYQDNWWFELEMWKWVDQKKGAVECKLETVGITEERVFDTVELDC